jgi:hypothetical protein
MDGNQEQYLILIIQVKIYVFVIFGLFMKIHLVMKFSICGKQEMKIKYVPENFVLKY